VSDCIFCRIVAGDAPAEIVFEDDLTLAFMDIFPATDGHVLVVPKAHAEDVYALEQPHADAVWHTTLRVAHAVRAALGPEGLTIRQANGRVASQHVFHVHVHVIPRNARESRGDASRVAEMAGRLRPHLA